MRKKTNRNTPSTPLKLNPNSPVEALVMALRDENARTRQDARFDLVRRGGPAVPALLEQLGSGNTALRWEVAKALTEIRDPQAAGALVRALSDEDRDVRWVASEGLISLGHPSLRPLLQGLIRNADSPWLREGALRVFHAMEYSADAVVTHPVIDALENMAPIFDVPIAAFSALNKLRDY
jgi:HEAT repeat protein